ncbi:MAG TPA: TonB-dependent receptor [Gammaproteobacteria bacterium]|nr:TonB-dependent receptor [Gammaproteobacteria bacterium]|tara:strand:- start:4303 stop:6780 length:2478 start_codon:yes stop_codon:yes gene_type:complete
MLNPRVNVTKPFILAIGLATCASQAFAQVPVEILVTDLVPAGSSVNSRKLPYPIQVGSAQDLQGMGGASLADFMGQSFSSVSVNDAQNNPLQRDLQYRGFTASPLLGLAQGLAIFQNGVRINEPLGDTVNWDLLPQTAINQITLSGGSNPLYGLNSLGGSLVIDMKNGFNAESLNVEVSAGSFGRTTANFEIGGNNGQFGYYFNVERFAEDGWRDQSRSDALNLYGSLSWRSDDSAVNLNLQHGRSDLIGNGAAPVELLNMRREAIFTGPDITENNMSMVNLDFAHEISSRTSFSGNLFWRENDTDSFNGDGTEFTVCEFIGGDGLIEGLEEDHIMTLGIDDDDLCEGQFTDAEALEDFLNSLSTSLGRNKEYNIEGFEDSELSGTGVLAGDAINNISNRLQQSLGGDFQWTLKSTFADYDGQIVLGGSYFNGESDFRSVLELAEIDPLSRITIGLGTGTFVDDAATLINTGTETLSAYVASILDFSDTVALTLSLRANDTSVTLRDRSGMRPELNGDHNFNRINPALGVTWQVAENHNLYASFSRSSRSPTPIELACNEGVFELSVKFAIERGDDPDDVDFECRLPNAFLADPPLDDVVSKSFEIGARGFFGSIAYSAGAFLTANENDILFQTTGRATGLFANVDETQRAGFEGRITGNLQDLNWTLAYSFVEATFEDNFKVLSPNHAFADDDGEILVENGDKIPGIPRNQIKLLTNYRVTDRFGIGLDVISNSDQHLRGDESNQLDTVAGYTLANLRARYQFSDRFQIFANVNNLFDEEFETFGLLGEEPGELEVPIIEDLTVPLFLGPAPPRAVFVGLRYAF